MAKKLLILALGVVGLGTVGTMAGLKAQELVLANSTEAIAETEKFRKTSDPDLLIAKQESLKQTIATLEKIPNLPGFAYKQAEADLPKLRSLLGTVEQNLQAIASLGTASTLAKEASILVQNPPHPVDIWAQAQTKWQGAIASLQSIPTTASVSPTAQQKLSAYRANLGAITKRLTIAQKAIEFNNRGIGAINSRNYQQALANFNLAIRLNPVLPEAYHGMGVAYSELGDNQKAIQQYDLAIKLNNNFTESYFSRGLSKYKLGNKEQALEDWNQAIKSNPNHAKTHLQRGAVFYELGNYQAAVQDFEKAAALFTQQGDPRNSQFTKEMISKIPESYRQKPTGNNVGEEECDRLPAEQCELVPEDPKEPYTKVRKRRRLRTIPSFSFPSKPNSVQSNTSEPEISGNESPNKSKSTPRRRRSRR